MSEAVAPRLYYVIFEAPSRKGTHYVELLTEWTKEAIEEVQEIIEDDRGLPRGSVVLIDWKLLSTSEPELSKTQEIVPPKETV